MKTSPFIFPTFPSVSIVAPISYEFQVVEYTNEKGTVTKVELQTRTIVYDHYGNIQDGGVWTAVPRIKIPTGGVI